MQPYEIRTVPARLPAFTVAVGIAYVGVLGYLVWETVTTVAMIGNNADQPSNAVVRAVLLAALLGLLWLFARVCAPTIQVVGMYLFRDRGKQVVAHRLDEQGWHHVVAGTDVVLPWSGMAADITQRTDDRYHLRLSSRGPFVAARDPFSRLVRRTLRKEGGLTIPMTLANPTEDELAAEIARASGGQVVLTR
ncbi:MAG TPA: hypothetical protein VFE07_11660 [Marmoricola sp.]|nr:hypothetical protein [Marmoricola sp.]